MRRAVLFSIILSVQIIVLCAWHAQAQEEIISVAFYNLENLFDTLDDKRNYGDDEFLPSGDNRYNSTHYQQKLRNLAEVLNLLGRGRTPDGPAFIGVAEVEHAHVIVDLIAQPSIAARQYRYVHTESRDTRGIDVACIYDPAHFTLLHARPLPVPLPGHKRTRDILFVQGLLAGDTVFILVNHWPSRRGSEAATSPLRKIAASVNRRVIDSLRSKIHDPAIIVMGDFNDNPTSPNIQKVLGTTPHPPDSGSGLLCNPFRIMFKKGQGSTAFNDVWSLFDQIMVSEAFFHCQQRWRFYGAEIFSPRFLTQQFGRYKGYPFRSFETGRFTGGYSDHFPVILYLSRRR